MIQITKAVKSKGYFPFGLISEPREGALNSYLEFLGRTSGVRAGVPILGVLTGAQLSGNAHFFPPLTG